jgi:hypothetical protein
MGPQVMGFPNCPQRTSAHFLESAGKVVGLLFGLWISIMLTACIYLPVAERDLTYPVPPQEAWIDHGTIFTRGELGDWDYQLFGGFALSAIKIDDSYFLYYQGTSAYRSDFDETVLWRAIGVATSPDGINFTKHADNPIITWFPNQNGEEGAVSSAVTQGDDDLIILYYGANIEQDEIHVNSDGRVALSTDGFNFTDLGVALDFRDASIWGSGDELFPVLALRHANRWIVYYIPNGTLQSGRLGVAYGEQPDRLDRSAAVRSNLRGISVWGTGGQALVGPDTYALFLNNSRQNTIEVRYMSPRNPNRLSAPTETYRFEHVDQATILLDTELHTWFMYYRSGDRYGLKVAPAGEPDTTPPSAPSNLTGTPLDDTRIELSWSPAQGHRTGIAQYQVYRDGEMIDTVKGWHFTDTGLTGETTYTYQVQAVNLHGTEGVFSEPVEVETHIDITPPEIIGVNASGPPDRVAILFNEPLDPASSQIVMNYHISPGIDILDVTLATDQKTIILTTTSHRDGDVYTLHISGIRDVASQPNQIADGKTWSYLHTMFPGLVATWKFDEGAGDTVYDSSNFGNHGSLRYIEQPGPVWVEGISGAALYFDGVDDQVTIQPNQFLEHLTSGSFTYTAWVNVADTPSRSLVNRERYTVLARNYSGLYYENSQQFSARLGTSAGTQKLLESGVFPPGDWRHLSMVVDAEHQVLHLFVDGVEVAGSPLSISDLALADQQAPYYIGASEPLTERYEYRFKGIIDEVRIYQRALSQQEIYFIFASDASHLQVP